MSSMPLSKHLFSTSKTINEGSPKKSRYSVLTKSSLRGETANELTVVLGDAVSLLELPDLLRCGVAVQYGQYEVHENDVE